MTENRQIENRPLDALMIVFLVATTLVCVMGIAAMEGGPESAAGKFFAAPVPLNDPYMRAGKFGGLPAGWGYKWVVCGKAEDGRDYYCWKK